MCPKGDRRILEQQKEGYTAEVHSTVESKIANGVAEDSGSFPAVVYRGNHFVDRSLFVSSDVTMLVTVREHKTNTHLAIDLG